MTSFHPNPIQAEASRSDREAQLILQQLADSAFPIGGQAHSFGLESLVSDGLLTVAQLENFLVDWIEELGVIDAWGCRTAYQLAQQQAEPLGAAWLQLNQRLSALRPAREGRNASTSLGRRFLALVRTLIDHPDLLWVYQQSQQGHTPHHLSHHLPHHNALFGLTGGLLALGEEETVLAYLHQSIAALLSATQKLLPVGQSQVVGILWRVKPNLIAAAERSQDWDWDGPSRSSFAFLAELVGMRHATLPVRLFIS